MHYAGIYHCLFKFKVKSLYLSAVYLDLMQKDTDKYFSFYPRSSVDIEYELLFVLKCSRPWQSAMQFGHNVIYN